MNKWQAWYDSLPSHTQKYLDKQAVWHDQDLLNAALLAFVMGVVVGLMI